MLQVEEASQRFQRNGPYRGEHLPTVSFQHSESNVERGEDVPEKSEQEHCVELLTGICVEGPQILAQGQSVKAAEKPVHEDPADLDSVPGREQLEKLIDKPNILEPFRQEQARLPMRSRTPRVMRMSA